MPAIKPGTPKGTRDFSPQEMVKRNYIFDTIKAVFRKYGYQEIQTPAMENLSTLTGKYGDEGDKLIFSILDSGELTKLIDELGGFENEIDSFRFRDVIASFDTQQFFVEIGKMPKEKLQQMYGDQFATDLKKIHEGWKEKALTFLEDILTAKKIKPKISEKALRYDLTVPFARYVVMHQNEITLPFKRFQVQPVWRADRPQKGRYREFYQCDADVVGSESLLNEAEFVLIYQEALSGLGLRDFTIKLNNRKILSGIAEIIGKPELIVDMTVAIDKLDKIGLDGVLKELTGRGFTDGDLEILKPVILLEGSNTEKLERLKQVLSTSDIGLRGIKEVETIFEYVNGFALNTEYSISNTHLELDITLARGLNYYTGAIFEVKTNEVAIGSIGGGGRYDDLTGMFGLKGLTGVGISFGADRIYDVLEELNLFPESTSQTTRVLISNFDGEAERYALPLLQQLRNEGIAAEIYPAPSKLKKQMSYADDKKIPFVILIGSDEIQSGLLSLKNMQTGDQQKLPFIEVLKIISGL